MSVGVLPQEILLEIICSSETPRDLWNTVRASRKIYYSFESHRLSVLRSVLRSAFADHFPEAVAACRARTIRDADLSLWPRESVSDIEGFMQREYLTNLVETFLDKHFEHRRIDNRDLDYEIVVSLCRLWFLVDRFVDIVAFSLLSACIKIHKGWSGDATPVDDEGSHTSSGDPKAWSDPLSAGEYSRIQRALVHWELCRRVFASSYKNMYSVGPIKQKQLLQKYFHTWEIVELDTIYNVLSVTCSAAYTMMYMKFRKLVDSCSHDINSLVPGEIETIDTRSDERLVPYYVFDMGFLGDKTISDSYRFPLMGLPSLHSFLHSDLPHQMAFCLAFGSHPVHSRPAALYFEAMLGELPAGFPGGPASVPPPNRALASQETYWWDWLGRNGHKLPGVDRRPYEDETSPFPMVQFFGMYGAGTGLYLIFYDDARLSRAAGDLTARDDFLLHFCRKWKRIQDPWTETVRCDHVSGLTEIPTDWSVDRDLNGVEVNKAELRKRLAFYLDHWPKGERERLADLKPLLVHKFEY